MVINSFGSIFSNLTSLIFPRERTWHLLYWYQNILADRNQLCRKYVRFPFIQQPGNYVSQFNSYSKINFRKEAQKMTTMVWPPNWDRKSGLTSYTLSLQICHRGPRWPPFNMAPINPGSLPTLWGSRGSPAFNQLSCILVGVKAKTLLHEK